MHNSGTGLKNTPRPGTPVEIFGACCSPWKMLLVRQFVAPGSLGTPQRGVTVPPHPHSQTLAKASSTSSRSTQRRERPEMADGGLGGAAAVGEGGWMLML